MTSILAHPLAVAFLIAGVAGVPMARAQDQAPAGDAGHGKQLYDKDGCFECHGYVGQGAATSGPRVAPTELPFDAFTEQLRHPSNEMPPYAASVVSDKDAGDIYAYLRSIPPPQQAAKDIPLLNR